MCGRYRLSRRKQFIEEHFDCDPWDEDWSPRYNIAPTQPVPVIRQDLKEPIRQISSMRWGLIPNWARDASIATGTINAKSETAATKPTFRDPLKFRRCLIPGDGFYEWARKRTSRQPFCFEMNDGDFFAFAGLWDDWKDPNGNWIKTCSILTTTPNAVTSAVHDRMPVILDPASYDAWLDPAMQNVAVISGLLKPYDARYMRSYPVGTKLNHVTNDDEQCPRAVEHANVQSDLFHEGRPDVARASGRLVAHNASKSVQVDSSKWCHSARARDSRRGTFRFCRRARALTLLSFPRWGKPLRFRSLRSDE